MEKLEKVRDLMRESADILDEFLALKQREVDGVDITQECDAILGRFFMNVMKLSVLQSQL